MTCIVGLVEGGTVWLGGDRAAVEDRHYLSIVNEPKVFRLGAFVIGFTSSFRMGQLLQHQFTPPVLPKDATGLPRYMAGPFADALRSLMKEGGWLKTDNGRDEGGVFLVGVMGRLFAVDNDFNVLSRTNGFDACGCGVSAALGALYGSAAMGAEQRVLCALEAGEQFTTGVRGPFDVVRLEAG